jgi:hemolytic enterotoxin HBL
MSAQHFSIGPSALSDSGNPDSNGFSLSRPEWVSIQTYCTDGKALPTTEDAFRKSLGSGAPKDLSDFVQLIQAYKAINHHVTTWGDTTFPATVSLANDVYDYGVNKAPVYYPALLKEAEILRDRPDDQQAKDALKAILDNLKKDADHRADKAGDVTKKVTAFAADTESDRLTLVGPDGKAGLVSYYDKRYGEKSKDVQELIKEISAQQLLLKAADEEYNHDVIVASTTPTYAWIWPIGTIAAAVVAGIYGKRAVEALDRARAARDKILHLQAKQEADANLMVAINVAQTGMGTITRDLSAALPVIQKIQGVWGGISADLSAISRMVDDDIRNVPPIIMDLGVDQAVKAWYNVAILADKYRLSAYVQEQPGVVSMSAWKIANQVSSSRLSPARLVAA